jgi:hypothetical protein
MKSPQPVSPRIRTRVIRHHLTAVIVSAIGLVALATPIACGDSTGAEETFFGPIVPMGAGSGRSFVTTLDNVPVKIGITFSETALTNLPGTLPFTEFLLDLPAESATTPFDHVTISWVPQGHPGMGYGVPHVDFHFYEISIAARAAIAPSDPQFQAKMSLEPVAAFIPSGYVRDQAGVPNMGTHWSDIESPEKNGQPFTSTFIYGSYNGAFTFMEPMVAKSFLDTHPSVTRTIKLPAQYSTPGYYPTSYELRYDDSSKEFTVSLGDFVHRD